MEIFTFTVTLVYCVRVQIFHLSDLSSVIHCTSKNVGPPIVGPPIVGQYKRQTVQTLGSKNVGLHWYIRWTELVHTLD